VQTLIFQIAFSVLAVGWVVLIVLCIHWYRSERRCAREKRIAQQRAGYRISGSSGTP
jgi:hypothetical protein